MAAAEGGAVTDISGCYAIGTEWDGKEVTHSPAELSLEWAKTVSHHCEDVCTYLYATVRAPFFDDPPPPGAIRGESYDELYEYEVIEVFFLGDDNRYLEVELSPHGSHLVLGFWGARNRVLGPLPLTYECAINKEKTMWTGQARVPLEFLPPGGPGGVPSLNAFAMHGTGESRVYEALHPATERHDKPDFHRLQYFRPSNIWMPPPSATSIWQCVAAGN